MNQFYNIRAAATEGAPNEVFIYDEIGFWGTTAQTFHNAIQALSGKIVVRINSPGGNVFDAIAIHSMLSRLPDVETVTDGLAASAASVIFAAGKARKMAKAAFVMIHNPWSYTQGSADDMRKEADILEGITNALVKLYKGSSSKSEEELREMMDEETWMNGDAALAAGFATEVFDAPVAKASVRSDRYSRTPKSLLAPMNGAEKAGDNSTMKEKILALLGVEANARETFLVGAFAALGVDDKAIEKAQASGDQSFLSVHVEARITDLSNKLAAAEARANEQEGIAKAFLDTAGVKTAPKDVAEAKTLFASAIKTAASKEAAEILASQGQTKPVDNHKEAEKHERNEKLTGLELLVSALRVSKN